MFLRSTTRKKNGKQHRYWSIVENKRCAGDKVVQRPVLYLGEINDQQEAAWQKTIDIFEHGQALPRTVALFPAERPLQTNEENVIRIKLSEMELRRPRQWGACWLFCQIYAELGLDHFWKERLPASRKGTRWDLVFQTLCAYRLIDPGSEWRLHRQWFEQSALGDLLGEDFSLAEIHKLYDCHDFILAHKTALFDHLTQRWKDMFNAKFEVLLYDLTSTYFESDPPFPEGDKRAHGYSRDKRPDCVQVVIALIVTPEGFPLAYGVMRGNTSDKTTLKSFLEKIEKQYGKAQRIWVMDRGIPTEETLAEMRASDPPVLYLVGTPKGRLTKLQKKLTELPWEQAREGVDVKLLEESGELYVLARSADRVHKERAMRRRQLKGLWKRLKEIGDMQIDRDDLLLKLGGAQKEFPSAWRLTEIQLPSADQPFSFKLRWDKLRQAWRREGRYLLRTNMPKEAPAKLWEYYLQLVQIESVFKQLKGDLAIRPIFHQDLDRIEAHIFISFLAYCVQATLSRRLKDLAPGLTARAVIEKMAALQMIDVHLPTTDQRTVILTRYTQPQIDQKLLLEKLKLTLPDQPPPRITAAEVPKLKEEAVVKT
jgi:transposase